MSLEEIQNAIPQRPPFLFLDRIIQQGPQSIHTQKHLTGQEDFFKGHFPGNPIMPGVLMMEAAFQSAGIIMKEKNAGKLAVICKVEDARFRHIVRPGDTLDIMVENVKQLASIYFFKGRISVDDKAVAILNFSCAFIKENE